MVEPWTVFPLNVGILELKMTLHAASAHLVADKCSVSNHAMRSPNPLGIMIARGDLAVVCGWVRLADIQEEIISICGAAHIPVIWATHVLESLVKSGLPTRAEITDVANGRRYFDYLFYVDFEASMADPNSQNALRHLEEFATFLRVLGSYPADNSQP